MADSPAQHRACMAIRFARTRVRPATWLLIGCLVALLSGCETPETAGPTSPDNPWSGMAQPPSHTDHAQLINGPFTDGPSVTVDCLRCHEQDAHEVMQTAHWTWLGDTVPNPTTGDSLRIGKANLLNNFCIGVQPNLPSCTACHAGYGWDSADFDFNDKTKIDCLICHDTTGGYHKGLAGQVAEDVDLLDVARNVGRPTRQNCGACHFSGGGGNGVKHGDMDGSLQFPPERVDVHMGRHDFACQTCHRTEDHQIPGLSISVSTDHGRRVNCTDCHAHRPHFSDRLNVHTDRVACQTCHIPEMAPRWPTKMAWDWSTAGQDRPDDIHVYLKKKGSFVYDQNVAPTYGWFNGKTTRYLPGDVIDPTVVTHLTPPLGDRNDDTAKIWPFKVHRGKQPYDAVHKYLLVPRTYGDGGFWTEYDWPRANTIGAQHTGLAYSGDYGFCETTMHWPLSHMVQPKEAALQCADCHGERGRLDWAVLGYDADPAVQRVLDNPDPNEPPLAIGFAPEDPNAGGHAYIVPGTGESFSGQKLYRSDKNLVQRDELRRPWDIHAERMLGCRHCHPGLESETAVGSEPAPTRSCDECHTFAGNHTWLPFAERHAETLACEACHVPQAYAQALESVDKTVLTADGQPVKVYRGIDGPVGDAASMIRGYRPVLLSRPEEDGRQKLAPYNLVATWYWVDGPEGQLVSDEQLTAAYLNEGGYRPEILATLDADQSGTLETNELRLDTPQKFEAVRLNLQDSGVEAPQIIAKLEPYGLHHGVGGPGWATQKCNACHGADGALSTATRVAAFVPGQAQPTFTLRVGTAMKGRVALGASPTLSGTIETTDDGELYFRPAPEMAGLYLPGRNSWPLGEIIGWLILGTALSGMVIHGSFRFLLWRHKLSKGPTESHDKEPRS